MLYLTSSDISESLDSLKCIKQGHEKYIIDLKNIDKSTLITLETENFIIEKLIYLCSSNKADKSQDLFPYTSNLYQNSVYPNVQLVIALSKLRAEHRCISLPYKYVLVPRKSFYAMAKGESQASFLVDSYQFYYHVVHQWATSNSLKIKYRNHPRLGLIDNCFKPVIRALALNVKVFMHLFIYFFKTLHSKALFWRINSQSKSNSFTKSEDLLSRIFLVRTDNHLEFFRNSFSSLGQYYLYQETSLTDSFGIFNSKPVNNSMNSLLFASSRFIVGLLILQISLLFRKNYYFSAFSFSKNILDLALLDDVSLPLEDALFEVQQIYLELVLFKQNFSKFLTLGKTRNPALSEIVSFECRSPHSFVISSLSRDFGCQYIQYQPCLFANSPLSIFPNSDSLFIGQLEDVDKFKSFFMQRKPPQIFHHNLCLTGTTYFYSRSSPPVIFFHPRNPQINNLLLSCDYYNHALIKYHPRLNSFLADKNLYPVYRSRLLPKNADTVKLSVALTYCSAAVVELINCGIPFVCLSPSRDYIQQPFYSASYVGFCTSRDEALYILNNTEKLFTSFSICYSPD